MADLTDDIVTMIDGTWETGNTAKPGILAPNREYLMADVGNNRALLVNELNNNQIKLGPFANFKRKEASMRVELRSITSEEMKTLRNELVRVLVSKRTLAITGWCVMRIESDENTDWKFTNLFSRTLTIKLIKYAEALEN